MQSTVANTRIVALLVLSFVLAGDSHAFGECDNSAGTMWWWLSHFVAAIPVVGGIIVAAWDDCGFSGTLYWICVPPLLALPVFALFVWALNDPYRNETHEDIIAMRKKQHEFKQLVLGLLWIFFLIMIVLIIKFAPQ